MTATISLLTKQELSITRRVFQWLFGGNIDHQMQLGVDGTGNGNGNLFQYFETHTLDFLVSSLLELFSCKVVSQTEAELPYEVLSKVMDRLPERLRQTVSERCMLQILYHMRDHAEGKSYSQSIQKISIQLINKLPDPLIVWSELEKLVDSIMSPSVKPEVALQTFDMISSIVHMIPPNQEKLADLFFCLTDCMQMKIEQEDPQVIQLNLVLCINLFTNIKGHKSVEDAFNKFEVVFDRFIVKLLKRDHQMLSNKEQLEQPRDLDAQQRLKNEFARFSELFKHLCSFMTSILTRRSDERRSSGSSSSIVTGVTSNKRTHTRRGSDVDTIEQQVNHDAVHKFLDSIYACCMCNDPYVSIFSIETLITLITSPTSGVSIKKQQRIIQDRNYIKQIVNRLWNMLIPEMAVIHFEAARLLVELYGINKFVCNAVVSDAMLHYSLSQRIEGHRRFALVWRLIDELHIQHRVFDEGLFLMLDSIRSENSSIKLVGRSWLLGAMDNINRILDPLFQTLIDQETMQRASNKQLASVNLFDEKRAKHVLNLWISMMEVAPARFIRRAMEISLSKDTISSFQRHIIRTASSHHQQLQQPQFRRSIIPPSSLVQMDLNDYFSLLVMTCVRLMECGIHSQFRNYSHGSTEPIKEDIDNEENNIHTQKQLQQKQQDEEQHEFLRESIRSSTISFLRNILIHGREFARTTEVAATLAEPILAHLQISIEAHNAVFQFELLGILYTILYHLDQKSRINIRQAMRQTSGSTEEALNTDTGTEGNPTSQRNAPSILNRAPILKVVHSTSFLPTLLQGVQMANHSQTSSRYHSFSLLHYWVDHIISFLPFMHTALPNVVSAIVPHFCDIARENAISGLDSLRSQTVQVILDGLRHILQLCVLKNNSKDLNSVSASPSPSSSSSVAAVAQLPFRFFTDLVKDVFTHDDSIAHNERITPLSEARQILLSELPLVIETMTIIWKTLRSPYATGTGESQLLNSFGLLQFSSLHTKRSIETSITEFLNPLIVDYSPQLIASMVILWANFHPETAYCIDIQPHELDSHLVDIVNHLDDASPEIIINCIVDVIGTIRKFNLESSSSASSPPPSSRQSRRNLLSRLGLGINSSSHAATESRGGNSNSNVRLKENIGLSFLHAYLQKCILSERADSIVANMIILVRETLQVPTSSSDDIIFVYATLFKSLHQFLMRWSVMDERRLRYNLKDAAQKLVEACISASVREMAATTKKPKNASRQYSQRYSQINVVGGEMDPSTQTLNMLASCMVDVMQKVYEEGEPMNLAISMILPQLCQILRNHHPANVLRIRAVVKLMSTLQRRRVLRLANVKKELWSLFMEPKFFHVDMETLRHWRLVINEISKERDRPLVHELLSRLGPPVGSFTATPITGTIFLNRNNEAQNRGRLLKRMAFVLFSGEIDEYAAFIPHFQEKIVESLKLCNNADALVSQVFFFLRVLLTRMSPGNLRALWPMIVTELISVLRRPKRVDPIVLMEAVKLIDFAMVSLPEEFQMYKWMYLFDPQTADIATQIDTDQCILFSPYLNRMLQTDPDHHHMSTSDTSTSSHGILMDSLADFVAASAVTPSKIETENIRAEYNVHNVHSAREPLFINRHAPIDHNTISAIVSTSASQDRQRHMQMVTAISFLPNSDALDRVLENDFMEIETDELDRLREVVSEQHKRISKRMGSASEVFSILPQQPASSNADLSQQRSSRNRNNVSPHNRQQSMPTMNRSHRVHRASSASSSLPTKGDDKDVWVLINTREKQQPTGASPTETSAQNVGDPV